MFWEVQQKKLEAFFRLLINISYIETLTILSRKQKRKKNKGWHKSKNQIRGNKMKQRNNRMYKKVKQIKKNK